MGGVSLVGGWFPPTVVVLALLAVAGSLAWRQKTALIRQLGFGIPIAGAIVGLIALVDDGLALVPYQFPNSYYLYVGLIMLSVVWLVLGWVPRSWLRRITAVLACLLTTLMMVTLINEHYEYYPTVSALLGRNAQNQVDDAQLKKAQADFRRTRRLPDHGFTVSTDIPGTVSGFQGRHAEVWLPPQWVNAPTPHLPVLELLIGSPGDPTDWTRAVYADVAASDYARAHGGTAPILVMPDPNGSVFGDTECVDSHLGNAETYLTVDVLNYVRRTYGASTAKGSVALAGYSEGGTCSVMLALRHPDVYTAFADFSGLTSPTLGETVDPSATTQDLFGGNRAQYDAHDPLYLLSHNKYPMTSGWYDVGLSDPVAAAAQDTLVSLSKAADIATCAHENPGGHLLVFWTEAFRRAFPWLAGQVGAGPKVGCG